ncbi:MAG TPA: hypothetical protein VLF88_01145 [Candidatus Babeliales bacterium]|nr:hypothetical protein [Candidatus Babeliales bacterium]
MNSVYELDWDLLPDHMRFGSSYNEPLRLFRGEKEAKVARGAGLLSLAAEEGDLRLVYEFGEAVRERNETLMRILRSDHGFHVHRNGRLTPFISASPVKEIARRYSRQPDEVLVEFEVPVCRTVIGPHTTCGSDLPGEILVIDRVLPEEIIAVHNF